MKQDFNELCPNKEGLILLLDDQLSIEEEQQIDEHLRSCDGCNELLDEIDNERSPTPKRLVKLVRSFPRDSLEF